VVHFSALVGCVRMQGSSKRSSGVRFGQFELDLSEGRLLKKGLALRIENQPLRILATLVDHPGEMVSREELCANLWPDGTYVDFDEGLNTAVKKLRYALGDSAENPVFIETVPRRGYRFIAPVQRIADEVPQPLAATSPENGNQPSAPVQLSPETFVVTQPVLRTRWTARWIALGVVLLMGGWFFYRVIFPAAPHVSQITRLTTASRLDPWQELASDGSRLFFLEREGDHWNTRQMSTTGGESTPFGPSGRNMKIFAVSPDQSEILYAPFTLRVPNLPLWSMPLVGGAPRRIGNILVNGATFSPDSARIGFTNSSGVFIANSDGSGVRQLAALPECSGIAWSPDGKILRFTQGSGPHFFQLPVTGGEVDSFLPSWIAWSGRWTSDGSYFLFTSTRNGLPSIWALRESPSFPWTRPLPIQLTFAPLVFGDPLPSRDGHFIFVEGGLNQEIDVVRFDPASHLFKPLLPAVRLFEAVFSPDRQWILYTSENQLWRSRPDGSDRLHLAGAPSIPEIHFPVWSPDSKRILFQSVESGKSTIYLVSADGGPPQQPLPPGPSRRGPAWSPDGHTISFDVDNETGAASPAKPGIHLFDLVQGRETLIPASGGLAPTQWSPDGRFLCVVSEDGTVIKLLDLKTHRWTEVARVTLLGLSLWSSDSALYFQDMLAPGEPVFRFHPGTPAPQRVYSFEDILQTGAQRCALLGFAPDGTLVVQVNRGGGDVYALTVSLP